MNYNHEEKTLTISQNTGITFSVAFLLMIASALVACTLWVNTIQSRVDSSVLSIKENREEINKLKTSDTSNQIKFTEIQTELKGIGATQEELKIQNSEILKELRSSSR